MEDETPKKTEASDSARSKPFDVQSAILSLKKAAAAKKCWACGCLRNSLRAIRDELSAGPLSDEIVVAMDDAESHLGAIKYACLGCEECYPADAIDTLGIVGGACFADYAERREGWPPLPGDYTVLRYQAPVAICTLTGNALAVQISTQAGPELAIVGTMYTENLGIERLVNNIVANPNIRFLIVCGGDSQQRIGHLSGQSLISLARNGLAENGRIIGAEGKRPIIENLLPETVGHFRRNVEVIDRINECDAQTIASFCRSLAERNPGPATPIKSKPGVATIAGYLPARMVTDPAGYFVIYVDQARGLLSMEHYVNTGVLDVLIEGKTAAEIYAPAIERNLVSRLTVIPQGVRIDARVDASPLFSALVWARSRNPGDDFFSIPMKLPLFLCARAACCPTAQPSPGAKYASNPGK